MLNRYFVVAAVLFFSGCAIQSVDPSYVLDPDSDVGAIIGSISYAGRYSGYAVHFRNIETGKKGRLQIGESQALLPMAPKSDFDDPGMIGKLFAVELPVGRYEMTHWTVGSGAVTVSSTSPFSIGFEVDPGKAVYIGSFQFMQTAGLGLAVTGASLSYKDTASRDLAILRQKFPNLANAPLTSVIESGTDISGVGGESQSSVMVPLLIDTGVSR